VDSLGNYKKNSKRGMIFLAMFLMCLANFSDSFQSNTLKLMRFCWPQSLSTLPGLKSIPVFASCSTKVIKTGTYGLSLAPAIL
jgi:hypothetical protein